MKNAASLTIPLTRAQRAIMREMVPLLKQLGPIELVTRFDQDVVARIRVLSDQLNALGWSAHDEPEPPTLAAQPPCPHCHGTGHASTVPAKGRD